MATEARTMEAPTKAGVVASPPKKASPVLKTLEILGTLLGAAGLLFALIYLAWVVHKFHDVASIATKKTWDAWIFVLISGIYLIATYLIPKVPFLPLVHSFFLAISWVYLGGTGAAMIDVCNTPSTAATYVPDYCTFVRLGFVGFLFAWVAFMSLAIISSIKHRFHFSSSNTHSPTVNAGPAGPAYGTAGAYTV